MKKVKNLKFKFKSGLRGCSFSGAFNFAKSYKHKEDNNQNKSKNNLSSGNVINYIHSNFSNISSVFTASFQDNIAKITSIVKTTRFPFEPGIAASHTTAKLVQNAENTLNWAPVITKDKLIGLNLSQTKMTFNP